MEIKTSPTPISYPRATVANSPPKVENSERAAIQTVPPRPNRFRQASSTSLGISLVLHMILLTILALNTLELDSGRPVRRAAVMVDAVEDVRKDVFESVAWEMDPTPTLRDAGGGLKSLAEMEQEASRDDAAEAVAGLAALASGDNSMGLSDGQTTGANSLAEGLGDGGGAGAGSADFFGATAKGKSILYVIDRSYSMVNNKAMDRAVEELLRSLQSLGPLMEFQVIFYNNEVSLIDLAGRGLVRANPANLERARRQILSVRPVGGTDHVAALTRGIAMRPDIIMFLTDAEDIQLSEISKLSRLNRQKNRQGNNASINVIQFHHDSDKNPITTIEKLAKDNNGTYRLVNVDSTNSERSR